jgi:hypothetical protein
MAPQQPPACLASPTRPPVRRAPPVQRRLALRPARSVPLALQEQPEQQEPAPRARQWQQAQQEQSCQASFTFG